MVLCAAYMLLLSLPREVVRALGWSGGARPSSNSGSKNHDDDADDDDEEEASQTGSLSRTC